MPRHIAFWVNANFDGNCCIFSKNRRKTEKNGKKLNRIAIKNLFLLNNKLNYAKPYKNSLTREKNKTMCKKNLVQHNKKWCDIRWQRTCSSFNLIQIGSLGQKSDDLMTLHAMEWMDEWKKTKKTAMNFNVIIISLKFFQSKRTQNMSPSVSQEKKQQQKSHHINGMNRWQLDRILHIAQDWCIHIDAYTMTIET